MLDKTPSEMPVVLGSDNFYIAKIFDAATGAPLPLSAVASIKCQFRDKKGKDASIVMEAKVSGLQADEGEVLIHLPAEELEKFPYLKPGHVLWADLQVKLVTGHMFNKPVGGQAFRIIERVTE